MSDKLMKIPNDDTQNYPFCRLKLVIKSFEHATIWTSQLKFTNVPKVGKLTNKKT